MNENRRQFIHFGVLIASLLLPFMSYRYILLLLSLIVVCTFLLMYFTSFFKNILRDGESVLNGVTLYPLVILISFYILNIELGAVVWAILASGDACANIIGRYWGKRKLLWNKQKTMEGLAAFFISAFICAILMFYWISFHDVVEPRVMKEVLLLSLCGASVGSVAESLSLPLDDNLVITVSVGCVLWGGSCFV